MDRKIKSWYNSFYIWKEVYEQSKFIRTYLLEESQKLDKLDILDINYKKFTLVSKFIVIKTSSKLIELLDEHGENLRFMGIPAKYFIDETKPTMFYIKDNGNISAKIYQKTPDLIIFIELFLKRISEKFGQFVFLSGSNFYYMKLNSYLRDTNFRISNKNGNIISASGKRCGNIYDKFFGMESVGEYGNLIINDCSRYSEYMRLTRIYSDHGLYRYRQIRNIHENTIEQINQFGGKGLIMSRTLGLISFLNKITCVDWLNYGYFTYKEKGNRIIIRGCIYQTTFCIDKKNGLICMGKDLSNKRLDNFGVLGKYFGANFVLRKFNIFDPLGDIETIYKNDFRFNSSLKNIIINLTVSFV